MKFVRLVFCLMLILTLAFTLNAEDKECYDCHTEAKVRFQKETVHPPVEDEECDACHEDHEDKNELILTAEAPDLCLDCHDLDDEELQTAHQKYPMEEAICYNCHNPHASDNAKLIRAVQHSPFEDRDCETCHGEPAEKIQFEEEGSELCYQCHDNKADKKNVHPPVEDGECTSCHSPHATDYERQLLFKGADVCYQCHDRKDEGRYVHKPVAEGMCYKCHSPHSSDYQYFLLKRFPEKFYMPYEDGAYELCFSCHKDTVSDLARKTSGVTKFVRNNMNLHAKHVNQKKKGRTCKSCHDVHSADQPKQIRSEVPFGRKYKYPFNYTKFRKKKGGRCAVGCHKTRTYGPAVIESN